MMLFRDGNIKDNLYFFHCTCSYILTFKCDYVFLYISFKVPFSIPCLFSREGVLQTSHFILKTIQKMSISETGFGRNHLKRLDIGLYSCLRIVHWGLQEKFTVPKSLAVSLHAVVWFSLVDRWESEGVSEKLGWCTFWSHALGKG